MNTYRNNNFKVGYYAFFAIALICILAFLPFKVYAATPDIAVDDTWAGTAPGTTVTYGGDNFVFGTTAFATIQDGVDAASDGNTVGIAAGTYDITTTITVAKNITLEGENPLDSSAVQIQPSVDVDKILSFEDPNPGGGVYLTAVGISNLTLDGTTVNVKCGIYSEGPLAVSNIVIQNVSSTTIDPALPDIGLYIKDNGTILNLDMSNIGRYGVFIWENTGENIQVDIEGFEYIGKGAGDFLDYGIEVASGAICNINNATISNCKGELLSDGSASAGIVASTFSGAGTTLNIINSDINDNSYNIAVGYEKAQPTDPDDSTTVTISDTKLVPATGGTNIDSLSTNELSCEENWWGTYSSSEISNTINATGGVDYLPFEMSSDGTKGLSDKYLGDLVISQGTLTPIFDSLVTNYTATVDFEIDSIDITPSLIHTGGSITVNGNAVNSGAAKNVSLNEGNNTVTVIVTATSGTITYNLDIYREHSYLLSALAITDGVNPLTLEPVFASTTYDYVTYVDNTVNTVDITATEEDTGQAVVTGTGAGKALNAAPADTAFTISCESSDNVTKNYTITVKRISSDAKLSDIKVNGVTIQGFDPSTYSYTKTVDNSVSEAVFAITTQNDKATYTINGAAIAPNYALSVGANTFTIVVTAQDATTTQTYTVEITRAPPALNNAKLSSLSVDGTPVAGFDPNVTSYTVGVAAGTATVNVAAVPQDALASVTGTGVNTLNPGGAVTLIGVEVTAQDGVTTKTYTLTIVEQTPGDAKLADLAVDGTTVSGFAQNTYAYTVNVDKTTTSVTVSAIAADVAASVSGTGLKSLNYGDNTATVTVTASDGVTTQDYVLTINRAGGDDTTLSDLKVDGSLVAGFDPSNREYTAYVDKTATNTILSATPTIPSAVVSGTGTFAVSEGENTFDVDVLAADGVTTGIYRVTVVHPGSNSAHLSDITIDGVSIDDFEYDTLEYIIEKSSATASVNIGAVALDSSAVISGTGTKTLTSGGNDFTITVVSHDGTKTVEYKLTIFRGYNADATLKNITVEGTLVPSFSPTKTLYTYDVANTKTSVTLWAEPNDDYASVTGLGHKSLDVGDNTFRLVCKADNDTTTKDYYVNIVRASKKSSSGSSGGSSGSGSSGGSGDSSDTGDSSSTGDTDDSDDADDVDEENEQEETPVVTLPESIIEVVEDILLKDAEKVLVGKTTTLVIDEDAFFEAIADALSKKKVEEGDGSNGVKANAFVSFPKANSIDDNKSVAISISGNGVKEAFKKSVGMKFTLDNFKIVLLPDSFDTEAFEESVLNYIMSKKIFKDEDIKDLIDMLDKTQESIYAFETVLKYETKSGGGGYINSLQEPATVSIVVDSNLQKDIEDVVNISEIVLYVYDDEADKLMALDFAYDAVSKTLQFETKRLSSFVLAKKVEIKKETIAEPVDNVVEDKEKKPFPTFMVIISVVAAAILATIVILLVRRSRTRTDNDNDITI